MATPKDQEKYRMTLSLNVLNHLGINLYSNVPAVLSEVVANAWDADAEKVNIKIYKSERKIEITDDGHGMTVEDINNKFLTVGYQRRKQGESSTPKYARDVMGRKGIGKLSLFSIAEKIEVYSIKNGVKSGFLLDSNSIKECVEGNSGTYYPKELSAFPEDLEQGTRIKITELKKRLTHTPVALKKRLARRFSVMGNVNHFQIVLDGEEISIEDRDYFHKLQFVWTYGEGAQEVESRCSSLDSSLIERSGDLPDSDFKISGWIGSAEKPGDLKDGDDNLNKIVVMMRGKLALEDILEQFNEAGIYSSYLIGEINADFLDLDEEQDIATSSRQSLIEDDPRFLLLKQFLQKELKIIQNSWSELRNDEGTKKALEIEPIRNWFNHLQGKSKKKAQSLFGKINQLTVGSEEERKTLLKHGILAFETLRYRESLDSLDAMDGKDILAISEVFSELDDIESSLYHQIVKERLSVIDALRTKVDDDDLERVIQEHLFEHLWLLDPSWERGTQGTAYMEQQAQTEFEKVNANLSVEEKNGRIDIKYKTPHGKHVIIELKKPGVSTKTLTLFEQVKKYRNALLKLLQSADEPNPNIEIICLLGKPPSDWNDPNGKSDSKEQMKLIKGQIILYRELIDQAYNTYKSYLEGRSKAGRLMRLLEEIDNHVGP